MFTTVKAWKVDFLKNATAEGGAMNEAIKNKKGGEIVIHSHTNKHGRMWASTTPENYLKMIEKNKGLYEVITRYPFKVHFDIDKEGKDEKHLEKIKKIIKEKFPFAEMAISGSITDAKTSFHIVLNNYIIEDEEQRELLKQVVKQMHEKHCESFDWKIYTNNRNMKSINQSKPDKPTQEIIEEKDFKKHCITCFFDDEYLDLPITDEIKQNIEIEKSKKMFDMGELPKMTLNTPDEINDIYECKPYELLKLLPLNKSFNHSYTLLIARFCFHNEISFEEFHAWYKNKSESEDNKKKWFSKWNILSHYGEVNKHTIINILSNFYPNIKKERGFRKFASSFDFPKDNIEKIETITQDNFKNSSKYLLFNVGMGGGKTFQTIEYLKSVEEFIWIAPNVSLSINTKQRFEENKINAKHYLEFKKKEKNGGILNKEKQLIVVLNSLHYLSNRNVSNLVIVIDEIETLLDKFLGDFLEQKEAKLKKKIWENFCFLLKHAKKVIFLDAFITTKTINFIKNLEENNYSMKIFERINEPQTREVIYIESMEEKLSEFEIAMEDMIKQLKDNKKLIIFYPFKNKCRKYESMEKLCLMLEKLTQKKGVYYNADVDDEKKNELKNVNDNWETKDFIITNNIVTCGVNYEKLDVDYKYIFIAGHNTPRDIIQFSYRARHLKTNTIKMCYMGKNLIEPNTWLNDCDRMGCNIYEKLYNDILIEKKSPLKKTIGLFCDKAKYKQSFKFEQYLNIQLQATIKKLNEELKIGYTYETITDISNNDADEIQNCICSQRATVFQKYQLRKYFFKKNFKNKEDAKLKKIWDDGYEVFFERLANVLNDDNNLFVKIQKLNNLKTCFPISMNSMKLNDELKDEIFSTHSFKYLTKETTPKKILKEIYNLYFNKKVIDTRYDKNKNVEYIINPNAFEYYEFAKENYKLEKDKKNKCLIDDDNEEVKTEKPIAIKKEYVKKNGVVSMKIMKGDNNNNEYILNKIK